MLIAMPQCAIAQAGSALAICWNCRSASPYQKSCSKATPRTTCGWTAGAQDTGNDTVPRLSATLAGAEKTRMDRQAAVDSFMAQIVKHALPKHRRMWEKLDVRLEA